MVERRKKHRAGTPGAHPLAASARLRARQREERRKRDRNATPPRQRVTFLLPAALVERLRGAVLGTPGATMAGLVAGSLERTMAEMENERGAPFSPTRRPLKRGRPPR